MLPRGSRGLQKTSTPGRCSEFNESCRIVLHAHAESHTHRTCQSRSYIPHHPHNEHPRPGYRTAEPSDKSSAGVTLCVDGCAMPRPVVALPSRSARRVATHPPKMIPGQPNAPYFPVAPRRSPHGSDRSTPCVRGASVDPERLRSCLAVEFPFVEAQEATIKEKARAEVWMSAACMPDAWYSVRNEKTSHRYRICPHGRPGARPEALRRATKRDCLASWQERRQTAQDDT